MNRQKTIQLLAILGITIFLSACGSSGGSSPSAGGSTADFVILDEFDVLPPNLSDGEITNINWKTGYASPSSIYTFEMHLTDDPSRISDATKVFGLNCGLPNHTCDETGQASCTYSTPSSGFSSVTCRQGSTEIGKKVGLASGALTAIGKACIFDVSVQQVCDTKEVEMFFN